MTDQASKTEIGRVVLVQIHTDRVAHDGIYDRSRLLEVDELLLTPNGAVGWCDGQAILDGHHLDHPTRRPRQFDRILSVGFTGHYALMAERFGAAPLGVAAENIVVESDGQVTDDDLSHGITIGTGPSTVSLTGARVAAPCVPFTKFMLGQPDAAPDVVAPNRAFLHDGMRGFVMGLADAAAHGRIRVGDPVVVG